MVKEKDDDEDEIIEGGDNDEVDSDEDDKSSKKEDKDGDELVEVTIEEDGEKDERITVKKNKAYSEESLEEKRERRRKEKKLKKEENYLNRIRLRKFESENLELKKRLETLENLAPQFQKRVDAQEELQIDQAINGQAHAYRNAENEYTKAITEGNGQVAAQAQRIMIDASNKHNQLVNLKKEYQGKSHQVEEKNQVQKIEIPETVKMYARRWATKNEWFNPKGDDEESETARIIDKKLVSEGYDPADKDFWVEFDTRLKEEIPHVFEEEKPKPKPRPRQTNGSIGADSTPSNVKTVKIPERVVQMARDAGMWDDPKMQKVFIRNWKEQQRNNVKAN